MGDIIKNVLNGLYRIIKGSTKKQKEILFILALGALLEFYVTGLFALIVVMLALSVACSILKNWK